jgi:probable rRNA maturation factor
VIHVETTLEPLPVASRLIEGAANAALAHEGSKGELTVVLTDDRRLQQLNRDYLGIDAPTDVLAFPASETDPDTGAHYLGDVLISIPRAQAQAREARHPLAAEVQLLVVHGVLHLLGHDHGSAEERLTMWAAQGEVLQRIGLVGIVIPET